MGKILYDVRERYGAVDDGGESTYIEGITWGEAMAVMSALYRRIFFEGLHPDFIKRTQFVYQEKERSYKTYVVVLKHVEKDGRRDLVLC